MIKACINKLGKKQKQWLWFIALWLGGLLAVFTLSLIIKFLMNI